MPPMIRKAMKVCLEVLENPGPEWAVQDTEEAKDCLQHLLVQRFKYDRSNTAIVAAANAVLEADPVKAETP